MHSDCHDVPSQIKQALQHHQLQSPTPSHFSIVTGSPEVGHQQQVLSSPSVHSCATAQQHAQATAEEAAESNSALVFRQMSQVVIPAELVSRLEQLRAVELGQLTNLGQVRQGLKDVADELVRRSELLGTCVQRLAEGEEESRTSIQQLQAEVLQLRQNDVHQRSLLKEAERKHSETMSLLSTFEAVTRENWERANREVRALDERVAHSMAGQVGLRADLIEQVGASNEEQRGFLVGMLERHSEALESARRENTELRKLVQQLNQSLDDVQADVRLLKAQREGDMQTTRWVVEQMKKLEQTVSKLRKLDAAAMAEMGGTMGDDEPPSAPGRSEAQTAPGHPPGYHGGQSVGEQGAQHFELTPEPQHVGWEDQDNDGDWDGGWNGDWTMGLGKPPGLGPTSEPPPLPAQVSASAAAASERKDIKIHQGSYKLLKDAPRLDLASGGEPWEIGMRVNQWRVETRTLLAAIHPAFGSYWDDVFEKGRERYENKRITGCEQPLPGVESQHDEMESRLSLTLLRVLPSTVKTPVLEGSTSPTARFLLLLESLHEKFAPGGTEEVESIQRFLRQLPSAANAKTGLSTLRRWKLAGQRASNLGLPGQAPNEGISAMDSLVRVLERKNTQLAMKINLLRIQPDIVVPTMTGLNRYVAMLEVECRRLASDQEVRDARAALNPDVPVVAEASAGTGGKGKPCYYFSKPGGCWRGKDCPFVHSESGNPKGGKGKGKGEKGAKGKGAEGEKQEPKAKPKPKPKPKLEAKPKPKSEAKSAVAMSLLGVGSARVSTVRAVAKSSRGQAVRADLQEESESELSNITDAQTLQEDDSTASVPSSQESELPSGDDESLDRVRSGRQRDRHGQLWCLVLDTLEYTYWTADEGTIMTRARRKFFCVENPNAIAIGIWGALRAHGFDLPAEDVHLGDSWGWSNHRLC